MVTLEEIKAAVWDCGSQKASGPDGILFMFVKKHWDLLHLDIQSFFNDFFAYGMFPPGSNFSFFTLIPKVPNPLYIKDYRHISLIGVHYKIVLANRLAKVIDSIISHEQSAFISGRQILHGPLILSEVGPISSRTSILVNESPTSKFSLKRGLRQCDPSSPFLFIIVMQGLNIIFKDRLATNLFRGVKIGSSIFTYRTYSMRMMLLSYPSGTKMIWIISFVFSMCSALPNLYGVGVPLDEIARMAAYWMFF
nr:RNA-directed DNA polymerase, eukaryota [Tanacetum cinerariifolium]